MMSIQKKKSRPRDDIDNSHGLNIWKTSFIHGMKVKNIFGQLWSPENSCCTSSERWRISEKPAPTFQDNDDDVRYRS